ncbi:profilin family protein [Streptomyces sp. NPDC057010]|uniref:profilin family protein n=1 Tax=Streptomyces sp. NPDC057010 TaxID=3345997 RepID=UPI00363FC180
MDEAADLKQMLTAVGLADIEVLRMDGSLRAATGRPLTTVAEGRRLVSQFQAPTDTIAEGITVGGLTYVAAEADRRLLHGRRGGHGGVVAVNSPPYIVVARYDEGHRPADAVLSVANLADLLAGG